MSAELNCFNNPSSPMASAQSWIVDNLSSLISSNQDDEQCDESYTNENCNDLTLTKDNQYTHVVDEADCDAEVEKCRTLNQNDLFTNERIPKRPFSPEEIHNFESYQQQQQQQQRMLLANQANYLFNYTNQFSQFDELRPMDYETQFMNPSFPKSSSFNDELSNYANDSFKYAKVTVRDKESCHLTVPRMQLNQSYTMPSSDESTVKKKKLANHSLSSSAIGMPNYGDDYADTTYGRNLSTNSSFLLSSSSSVSFASNASSFMNSNDNIYVPTGFRSNQKSDELDEEPRHYAKNNAGLTPPLNLYNKPQTPAGFDADAGRQWNMSNTFKPIQYYQQQQQQQQSDLFQYNSGYAQNMEFQKFPKKITKSSTTMFNKENSQGVANQKGNGFFPHSTSYDSLGTMKQTKQVKPLTGNSSDKESWKMFQQPGANQTDFLLETSFNTAAKIFVPSSSNKSQISNVQESGGSAAGGKDLPILHVRNLDYKISADEWKRILLENFRKHCKEILSVNVVTNADKSLLGIVKLATKEDARLAISCLHHKKIGYKRLNVTFATTHNSPKSKIVALFKANELKEIPLTRFISLYETKYNQSIAINELFNLKEIVQIFHKDGQGRQIKLIGRNVQSSLDNEEDSMRYSPYCSLHSQRQDFAYKDFSSGAKSANGSSNQMSVGWLPNVIVSLRTFKSAVHKLLNDHGGQMPLLSFMDCYKCCIFNENALANTYRNNSSNNGSANASIVSQSNCGSNPNNPDISYQLIIDNENGVSLEHLITCAQDVQIQYNQGFFKQLQWENDKSKPINLQSRNSTSSATKTRQTFDARFLSDQPDLFGGNDFDESLEESQRKLNQFSHEVVELFKEKPRCIIQMSNFTTEYHKKYGRQLKLADYDSHLYQNLKELLESIPHILQILDSQYDKKLTLTHRVQVRRFSNDLIKVLKSHPAKQMFADEYPACYERHFGRLFEIRDYGVCYLEDMLAELPESIICRKEIEGRTFIQIPKVVQMDEERLCMSRLSYDIIDMLQHNERFSIQFNKFVPLYHHHFGRQCKLSNYGFNKLIELLEAMPETVHVVYKDNIQFVQLRENLMLDLICLNLAIYLEENNLKLKISLNKLEELYNSRYQPIYYEDFKCENFAQLFQILPIKKHFINATPVQLTGEEQSGEVEWIIQSECFNEKELKRMAKLMLKKLIDDSEENLLHLIKESRLPNHKPFRFNDLYELLLANNNELPNFSAAICNNRSLHFLMKLLNEFLLFDEKDEGAIVGLSELYVFAKQTRNLFRFSKLPTNDMTMSIPEIEYFYSQAYKNGFKEMSMRHEQMPTQLKLDSASQHTVGCIPYKRLGFTDVNLLFSQGLNLLVTVKKYAEKRICLNREFWSKTLPESASQNFECDSYSSPISPINNRSASRTPFTNTTNQGMASITPLTQHVVSSASNNCSMNFSRRSNFNNSLNNLSNASTDNYLDK